MAYHIFRLSLLSHSELEYSFSLGANACRNGALGLRVEVDGHDQCWFLIHDRVLPTDNDFARGLHGGSSQG